MFFYDVIYQQYSTWVCDNHGQSIYMDLWYGSMSNTRSFHLHSKPALSLVKGSQIQSSRDFISGGAGCCQSQDGCDAWHPLHLQTIVIVLPIVLPANCEIFCNMTQLVALEVPLRRRRVSEDRVEKEAAHPSEISAADNSDPPAQAHVATLESLQKAHGSLASKDAKSRHTVQLVRSY